MSKTMTQAEYSRYRGVSKVSVLNWRRRGAIVMVGDFVDVVASDRYLDYERPRFNRGGRATEKPT